MNKSRIKKFFFSKEITISITSAILGSLCTILFLPIQKSIEQSFWENQNQQLVHQRTIEKRLELLDQFVQNNANYKYCSMRVGFQSYYQTYKQDAMDCYFQSQSKLMGTVLQIRYYFKGDIPQQTEAFSEMGRKYEENVLNGFNLDNPELIDTTVQDYYDLTNKLVESMKNNLYEK